MYKLTKNIDANTSVMQRLSDNAFIPMDESNTDYQEYLKWLAEGNEVLPPNSQE
jgi:hypothetical protein